MQAMSLCALGVALASSGCSVVDHKYSPAFVDLTSTLHIFHLDGGRLAIPLDARLRRLAFSADGKVIYEELDDNGSGKPGITKIDIDTRRESPVAGSIGFEPFNSLAASPAGDKLYISGGYSKDGAQRLCGLFALTLATGEVRRIAEKSTCDYVSSWVNLGASPDGTQIIAYADHELERISSDGGAIDRLGRAFEEAVWSPDGRWLAAVDAAVDYKVRILDARSMKELKLVGSMAGPEVAWSPDSRHLLGFKRHDLCGPYNYTLEIVDVETGVGSTVWSSWCKVNRATIGWVDGRVRGPQ